MSDKGECWKDVTGYAGRYQVSSLGNVRSMCSPLPVLLATRRQAKGKKIVCLHDQGKPKYYQLHRLVAIHFLPVPVHGERYVVFKDRNTFNCKASNLYWVRRLEVYSRDNPEARTFIPREFINLIRLKINRGEKTTAVARRFGCTRSVISRIVHRSIN